MKKLTSILVTLCIAVLASAQQIQLCGTQPILIAQLSATQGVVPQASAHQTWLQWQVAQNGSIAFTLAPLSTNDDIDFILYRKHGETWEAIRTMQSGILLGASPSASQRCTGVCGLHMAATDTQEPHGCSAVQDNFLAPVVAFSGEQFALFISNYNSNQGVWWDYSGTAIIASPNIPEAMIPTQSDNVFTSRSVSSIADNNLEQFRDASNATQYLKSGLVSATNYPMYTLAGCITAAQNTTAQPTENTNPQVNIGEPHPNPAQDKSEIPLFFPTATELSYAIYQNNGAQILQQTVHIEKGDQNLYLDTKEWKSAAAYLIVLKYDQKVVTRIIVKQ
jgi:hypothetical protein